MLIRRIDNEAGKRNGRNLRTKLLCRGCRFLFDQRKPLLKREKRRFRRVDANGNDQMINKFQRPLDNVQMAIRHRIESAGIKTDARHEPPSSALPYSSSSPVSSTRSTETTRSFGAVRKMVTPCVARPAARTSSTGQRISCP